MTLAPLLTLAAALLAAAGLHAILPERRAAPPGRMSVGGRVIGLLVAAGRRVRPRGVGAPLDLEGRLAAAGLGGAGSLGARELMGAKVVAAMTMGAGSLLVGAVLPGRLGVAAAVTGPIAGFLAPDLWLRKRTAERFRAVRRQLPSTLDLLRVTVEAGLPLSDALGEVGERSRGPLGAEWRRAAAEVELGVPVAHALQAMAERLPLPEIVALVGALERAGRHGSPLAETLAAQARDALVGRRRRIQEEAARAGPKIQLVVALLLVPSVLLLIAAALAAAFVDSGGGLLVG